MSAVFSSAQTVKGAFRADKLRIQFGPIQSGMLAQQISFSFAQQIAMIYEIGSAGVYLIGGRAQGTAGLNRIVGPAQIATPFFAQFGDVCRAADNNINFNATSGCGATANSGVKYRLEGCVINNIGVGLTSQEVVINEQIQMTFVNLDRG